MNLTRRLDDPGEAEEPRRHFNLERRGLRFLLQKMTKDPESGDAGIFCALLIGVLLTPFPVRVGRSPFLQWRPTWVFKWSTLHIFFVGIGLALKCFLHNLLHIASRHRLYSLLHGVLPKHCIFFVRVGRSWCLLQRPTEKGTSANTLHSLHKGWPSHGTPPLFLSQRLPESTATSSTVSSPSLQLASPI